MKFYFISIKHASDKGLVRGAFNKMQKPSYTKVSAFEKVLLKDIYNSKI